jgi:hypothetical protein
MSVDSSPIPPPLPNAILSEAETIRKAHLTREASIQSIGTLYLIGAFVGCTFGIVIALSSHDRPLAVRAGTLLVFVLFAAFQVWVGIGLHRLRPWSRIPSGILSAIGLFGVPIGTLINGYLLYLLFSKKSATVFSAPYRGVIVATPHIKYKTSRVVLFFAFLLVAVLGLIAIAAIFHK